MISASRQFAIETPPFLRQLPLSPMEAGRRHGASMLRSRSAAARGFGFYGFCDEPAKDHVSLNWVRNVMGAVEP
jgi:hypothetical protein